MDELNIGILACLSGVIVTAAIAFVMWRNQSRKLVARNEELSSRVTELEVQLAKGAAQFHEALGQKMKTHADEVDRLAEEARMRATKAREEAFVEGQRKGESKMEDRANALTVTVQPYVNVLGRHGLFNKTRKCEVGYQYQLLVHGLPCFKPHVIVEQTTDESEYNKETLDKVSNVAVLLAQNIIQLQGGETKGLFRLMKNVVVNGKQPI